MKKLVNMKLAGINCRNSQGYKALHVAARRKESSIIMALLTGGASASATTTGSEQLTAVTMCRRYTRPKDYNEKVVQGKDTNKGRLCIGLLEGDRRNNPASGSPDLSAQMADDLERQVDDLEHRVKTARMLFPQEANLAIENAMHAFPDIEFARPSASGGLFESLDRIHLDESSEMKAKRLMAKLVGLQKTVETGRYYFPHCSEVIDRFLSVDHLDVLYLKTGSPEEQRLRKRSYMKIIEDVQKAFYKDTADNNCNNNLPPSSISSSSSSSSASHSSRARKR
uniref:NPR1/NIM1-like C-terminal domain-containing protein n=1 Tax=Kalanchoe fedtschenkoi TaxID=63787 RepID=A0A7N0RJK7_KALFE